MPTRFLSLLLLAVSATSGAAQTGPPPQPGPYLFVLDLAGTPLDEFPTGVKALSGTMTVVNMNGQHMLRASSVSELLITLPQALPADFTVEVDLIPKACCNPEDLMVEGTPTRNRGTASAELTWKPSHLMVVGGGPAYQADMPADLAAATPGNLTQIVMAFSGPTVKLYTNGRRLYTLDRQFARGRVLRVFLGGQDDGAHAVYVAGLRIGTGAVAPGVTAQSAGLPTGGPPAAGTPAAGAPAPTTSPPTGQPTQQVLSSPTNPLPTVPSGGTSPQTATMQSGLGAATSPVGPTNFAVAGLFSASSYGVVIQWDLVPNAAGYRLYRGIVSPGSFSPATGLSGQVITPIDLTQIGGSTGQLRFDPLVYPGTSYVYWAEAFFADGTVSLPSIPGTVTAQASWSWASTSWFHNLRATVSPTASVTVTGLQAGTSLSLRGGTATMPGSNVTWTWTPATTVFGYEIEWSVVDNGVTMVLGRERVNADWSSFPLTVPPVTKGIPAGKTVRFCLAFYSDPDPTKPLDPNSGPCVTSQVPAAPTTSTVVQGGPISPRGTVTVMSGGLPPTFTAVQGSGTSATVSWGPPMVPPPASFAYTVSRAVAGTTTWTPITPAPISGTTVSDVIPDITKTYTYQVRAIASDGTFGTANADYTPAPPADPSGFTASQVGADRVELTWQPVAGVSSYRLSGPGLGTGISVPGSATLGPVTHIVTGLPLGSHTWTVASDYRPGGVLTASATWPRATATVAALSGRYRVSLLGFDANRATYNDGDADGLGDEVYLAALVALFDRATGTPGAQGTVRSVTYGDVTGRPQRATGGTLSTSGGIKTGDAYPLSGGGSWTTVNPQKDRLPMLLWEGPLSTGTDALAIEPALFESDVDAPYGSGAPYQEWVTSVTSALPALLQSSAVRTELTAPGLRWIRVSPNQQIAASWKTVDHPIGMVDFSGNTTNPYHQNLVILTREKIESVLSTTQTIGGLARGTIAVPLEDAFREGFYGYYTIYLRVERIP